MQQVHVYQGDTNNFEKTKAASRQLNICKHDNSMMHDANTFIDQQTSQNQTPVIND